MRSRLSVVAAVVVGASLLTAAAPAKRPAVRITITPATVLLDQAVRIRVAGLHARQTISLVTETRDSLGKRWRSRVLYRATSAGVVDTHRGMRPFWALEPVRKPLEPSPFLPTVGQTTVTIRAVAGRHRLATGTLARQTGR